MAATWSLSAQAQVPDLIDISAQYVPGVTLPATPPASAQVSSYEATLNAPIVLSDSSFFIPGVSYHVDSVSFANTPPRFVAPRAFHSIELPLLFVQLLPSDWSLTLRVAPGLAGDMAAVDSGLVRLSGLLLATHTLSEQLVLGGGGLASYSFGTFLPLPALYLDYKPFEQLRIEAFVPAFVDIEILPHDRIELGIRAEIAGNAYGIRDQRIRGRWPCAADPVDRPETLASELQPQPASCLDNIAYSVGAAGPTVSVRLFDTVWLNVFAAHTFFRRFEPMNENGEAIPNAQRLPEQLLIRAGATWRVPDF